MVLLLLLVLSCLVSACASPPDSAADSPAAAPDSVPVALPASGTAGLRNIIVDSALSEPQLVLHGTEYRLHLPPPMAAALAREGSFEVPRAEDYNANLRKYASDVGPRQALFAVVGDFDGDGRDDVVVHARKRGRPDSAQVFMAILNQSAEPRLIEVERYPLYSGPLGEYLTYQKPETIRSGHEKQPLALTTDAFQIVFFEKAAALHYYRDGKFVRYQTAD